MMSTLSPNRADDPPRVACARCGATFMCEPEGDCWCMHEPVSLPMPTTDEGCLCAACLRAAAAGT
jgi:hypothetical protein